MTPLSNKFSWALIAVAVVVAVGLPLLLRSQKTSVSQEELLQRTISDPKKLAPQRELDKSNFTNESYIIPRESNATGSIYSSRAQVRGTLVSWSSNAATVYVAKDEVKITIPASPLLYCFPQYFDDPRGGKIQSSKIWIDLTKANPEGKPTDMATLRRLFPKGSDIMFDVSVAEGDAMTSNMAFGFGCSF